jgi:hypothetical protein
MIFDLVALDSLVKGTQNVNTQLQVRSHRVTFVRASSENNPFVLAETRTREEVVFFQSRF